MNNKKATIEDAISFMGLNEYVKSDEKEEEKLMTKGRKDVSQWSIRKTIRRKVKIRRIRGDEDFM